MARNENQERITVHTYVKGSDIKTVNAAYMRQTCPNPKWGYISLDNRNGDMFHCRNPYLDCNWLGDVDYVASMNIKSRVEDHQISRFTPYREVKKILDEIPTPNGKPKRQNRCQDYRSGEDYKQTIATQVEHVRWATTNSH
ncbi:hypothetical protein AXFE_06360 [Acidithrix ferrooxidans]|uniref:Uncharacterized protein n=1 Tax=Acidithrix ferrooxidans TaxID=1280514 RepID=A0A0D8HKI0_9ACTN|nr:hypothetical protein AXFE_06360 [Acidithrix ferrooxidans]